MAGGDVILVLGDDREPLHRVELGAIREPLRLGHLFERGAQAGGALLDRLLEMGLMALQRVLRLFHLQQREGPDAKLRLVHRLGDEVVGARLDRAQPIFAARHRGHHDHRHAGGLGILPDAAADLVAVHARHDDVEQHEVGAEPQLRECFDAVARRFRLVPESLDQRLRDAPGRVVVVDDENPFGEFRDRLSHSRGPDADVWVKCAGRGEMLR